MWFWIMSMIKGFIRGLPNRFPMIAPFYARVVGVRSRKILVVGQIIQFESGPREYIKEYGVDNNMRYEGPFVDRLAASITSSSKEGEVVFFDVGGAVGFDSLMAHKFGASKIYIFEPAAVCHFFIHRNLKGIDYVLIPKFVGCGNNQKTINLDSFCEDNSVIPTHIKLDVEGHEIFILDGMQKTIQNYRPKLFIEFHERLIRSELGLTPNEAEARVMKFFEVLKSLNYKIIYNGHHYSMAMSGSGLYDDNWFNEPPQHVNFAVIAVPH